MQTRYAAVRLFLLVEAAAFAVASQIHAGILLGGYEHREARIAETVLTAVLLAGLLATYVWPHRTRTAGLAAQAAALLGTCVGIFTIIVGVGPQSAPDIVYHIAIVVVLIAGLVVAVRLPTRCDPGS
jgi:hypothetical protein